MQPGTGLVVGRGAPVTGGGWGTPAAGSWGAPATGAATGVQASVCARLTGRNQVERSDLTACAVDQRVAWAAEEAGQVGINYVAQQAVCPLGGAPLRARASMLSSAMLKKQRKDSALSVQVSGKVRSSSAWGTGTGTSQLAHVLRTETTLNSEAASPQTSTALS